MILDKFNRPLRDLRISLIDRCNFRCPYCMPAEQFHHAYQFLNKEQWLGFDALVRLVKIFVSLGVTKLRLTGGEPLLRPKIDVLIKELVKINGVDDVALTTNGMLLDQWALPLKQAGLTRLTVSLDSLDQRVFNILSGGRGDLSQVLKGIDAAVNAGFTALKINAVIQRGVNDQTVLDLVRHFRGTGHVLRFIEYMDVGNQNKWDYRYVVPSSELLARIRAVFPLVRLDGTQDGETSERYAFEDGAGEIGFISSVTKAFCGTCNRLRLSADGKVYTCLFAGTGTDLGVLLRQGLTDKDMKDVIIRCWNQRDDQYSQLRSLSAVKTKKIEMFQIGG